MKFQVGDKVKVNQETLDATKRQRVNGKSVDGEWISWYLIKSGREGAEFIVTHTGIHNVHIKKVLENGETYSRGWYSSKFFVQVNNVLDYAEEF